MKWLSGLQNTLDEQQNITILRTPVSTNVSKTGKVTAHTKPVRWNFLESRSQKNVENWWTESCHLFEARSLTRQKRLWYPSCPSLLLPPTEWSRLPLDGFPWKRILRSFVKICLESRNLIAVGQNYREIAVKAPSWSAMVSGY